MSGVTSDLTSELFTATRDLTPQPLAFLLSKVITKNEDTGTNSIIVSNVMIVFHMKLNLLPR